MIDSILLYFSFIQGVVAFFAPCSVALLPGYLSMFITRDTKSTRGVWIHVFLYSMFTISGIVSVYVLAGLLIFTFQSLIKQYLVYITIPLGIFIIILGILMLLGKQISLPLHSPRIKSNSHYIEAYLFGGAYAIGSLGCLFPLFLVVITYALNAGSIGIWYLLAYALGMSCFMVLFYILAITSRKFLQKSVLKFMPYVLRISGMIVIIAGAYIIWYQSALLI